MGISRTTITASSILIDRVGTHARQRGENLTAFYNRAILNQLENDGDFEIRDLVEEELSLYETESY